MSSHTCRTRLLDCSPHSVGANSWHHGCSCPVSQCPGIGLLRCLSRLACEIGVRIVRSVSAFPFRPQSWRVVCARRAQGCALLGCLDIACVFRGCLRTRLLGWTRAWIARFEQRLLRTASASSIMRVCMLRSLHNDVVFSVDVRGTLVQTDCVDELGFSLRLFSIFFCTL